MPQEIDPFQMRLALGHPKTCTEGVSRRGEYETCDKVAVALAFDPGEEEPYPVCAFHSRGEMVPMETIVRFVLDRDEAQRMAAAAFAQLVATDRPTD